MADAERILPFAQIWAAEEALLAQGSGVERLMHAVAPLAQGAAPFAAARGGVWLHAEAARLCPPALTARMLAAAIPLAYGVCL